MKYPRTPHLPFSPGGTNDDKRLSSVSHLLNTKVVITEKLDGSNVCLNSESCFARTHSGPPTHESFDAFKSLHASIKYSIPQNISFYGEWCFAKHSIKYTKLPSFLLIFAIRDNHGLWFPWEEVEFFSEQLGFITVPVLVKSSFSTEKEVEDTITKLSKEQSVYGDEREGLVIRKSSGFKDEDFSNSIAKFVRKDHVQSSKHWKAEKIEKNGLNNK